MSTVGFGDYHPKSDSERIACTLLFLFGVMIFSLVMGKYIKIWSSFNLINKNLSDGDNLTRFIGCLRYYNGDKEIS